MEIITMPCSASQLSIVSHLRIGGCIWDLTEYVYKIISSQPFPDDEIARLLGLQLKENETLSSEDVTWIHRQIRPHAYPQFNQGEPIFDDLEITLDLYYTTTVGEVVDTMEMGCRMGPHLATRLTYDKLTGEMFP